jgi:hypothetical protein
MKPPRIALPLPRYVERKRPKTGGIAHGTKKRRAYRNKDADDA